MIRIHRTLNCKIKNIKINEILLDKEARHLFLGQYVLLFTIVAAIVSLLLTFDRKVPSVMISYVWNLNSISILLAWILCTNFTTYINQLVTFRLAAEVKGQTQSPHNSNCKCAEKSCELSEHANYPCKACWHSQNIWNI